ncbi:MAG: hypothetical protein WC285_00105 [Candidatus Gracilibacteria bacterium]|jgi:hypothetical protein
MTKIKLYKLLLITLAVLAITGTITADAIVDGVTSYSTPARINPDLNKNPSETIDPTIVHSLISQSDGCTHPERCNSYSNTTCQVVVYETKVGSNDPVRHNIESCVDQGYSYATFNNYNLNLALAGAYQTNEQKFLIGRVCDRGPCVGSGTYYNTLTDVGEGDNIRFRLYVHNNGKDGNLSATANNVEVGIDLSNLIPDEDKYVFPTGFIKSTSARYREITDNMNVGLAEDGLILKPKLWGAITNKNHDNYYPSTSSISSITIGTIPATTVDISPNFGPDRVSYEFEKIPGCFQYSSYVLFDAVVVKNSCESLTATKEDSGTTRDGKILYRLSKTSLTFTETGTTIPAEIRYKWTTTDPSGRFYTSIDDRTGTSNSIITENSEVYYTGNGPVTLTLTRLNLAGTELTPAPSYLNQDVCRAQFEFGATCENLSATNSDNYLATIGGREITVHKFTYSGLDFSTGTRPATKLKWTSTDPVGRFYSRSGDTYTSSIGRANVYITENSRPPQNIYYGGAGTVEVHPILADGTEDPLNLNVPACRKSFTPTDIPPIIPPPPEEETACSSILSIVRNPDEIAILGNTLAQNTLYNFETRAMYNRVPENPQNEFIPEKGLIAPVGMVRQLQQIVTAGGITRAQADSLPVLALLRTPLRVSNRERVYFLTFKDEPGGRAIKVKAVGFTNPACSQDFSLEGLTPPPTQTTCNNLTVKTYDGPTLVTGPLTQNKVYKIMSTASYTGNPQIPQITYTAKKGLIGPEIILQIISISGGRTLAEAITLRPDFRIPVIVPDGTPVYFLPFTDQEGLEPAIKIEATRYESSCNSFLTLAMTTIPPNPPTACQSIDVSPASFDPNSSQTSFRITEASQLGNFAGNFKFSSTCNTSSFFVPGTNPGTNPGASPNPATFDIPSSKTGIQYSGGCADQSHSITIEAIGNLAGNNCRKTMSYTPTIAPPNPPPGGNPPSGSGGGHSHTPRIDKCILNPMDISMCRQEMFYGTTDKFAKATYKVTFTPNGINSATIKEDKILNSGSGTFDLEGITIVEEKNNRMETICNDELRDIKTGNTYKLLNKNFQIDSTPTCKDLLTQGNTTPLPLQIQTSPISGENYGFTIKNLNDVDKVFVFYEYKNNANLTQDICSKMTPPDCGRVFKNTASFTSPGNHTGHSPEIKVTVLCPYVLTRESGDVFFHSELPNSTSIKTCSGIDDSTGLVLRPTREDTHDNINTGTSTAPTQTLRNPEHDICKLSNEETGTLPEEYQNTLKNFSSSVCEMQADVAKEWKEKYINEAIKTNITKLTRWLTSATGDVTNPSVASTGIYYIKGHNLIIEGTSSGTFLIGGNTTPAAQTYIVEGGNLIINSNIVYNDSVFMLTNPKKIPSAAFIVIDGNIIIDKAVTQLDGIYMAVDTTGEEDGQINSGGQESDKTLTIRGSLIGDIYDLFSNRKAIGTNPLANEGSIVVKYDERILLNTPPGLNDLIDIAQLRVAR